MEILYHFLWQNRMLQSQLTLCDGRKLTVKSPGVHNDDAGPDFSHARISVDGVDWVGNVEIHVKASDWFRHEHQSDPAYDRVILHVVAVDDARIKDSEGVEIPQLELNVPPALYALYASLCDASGQKLPAVRCADHLVDIPELNRRDWIESLSVERLHVKANRILDYYRQSGSDWAQALFITLTRALGFGLNAVPFEMLAKSLPLKYVFHHADNRFQVEALLFGQAGLLDASVNIFDEYYQRLCREYYFLARKYDLRPINSGIWKFSRTRPQNLPHRRIAMLAAALTSDFNLTSALLAAAGKEEYICKIFNWTVSDYWKSHSSFGADEGSSYPSALSKSACRLLCINLAAPFYMAYGAVRGDSDISEYALDILRSLPAENNAVIRQWAYHSIKCGDAAESQALLHLRKEYCDAGRCLHCRFCHYFMADVATPERHRFFVEGEMVRRRLIIAAQDSWKGCLSSIEASGTVAEAARSLGLQAVSIPMADGGEGTADILGDLVNAARINVQTENALGEEITASYRLGDKTAFIDVAAASGLTLVSAEKRNPMLASSYGTGLLIADAVKRGAVHVCLGLGGSATVDAGLGLLAAIGTKIYDSEGERILRPSGADLQSVARIEPSSAFENVRITMLADVTSPLTGADGAPRKFGVQKGATEDQVKQLEAGMEHLISIMAPEVARFCRDYTGAGAAGGIGAGLHVWGGAEIVSGADAVIARTSLCQLLPRTRCVITGEGSSDSQTLLGKIPMGVLTNIRNHPAGAGVEVVLMAGALSDENKLIDAGFNRVVNINAPYSDSPERNLLDPSLAKSRLAAATRRILGG